MRRALVAGVFAVLVLAGCDAPTRPVHTERVRHLTFAGIVQPDGGIQMRATIEYPSDDGGPLRLGAPTLGSVDATLSMVRRKSWPIGYSISGMQGRR